MGCRFVPISRQLGVLFETPGIRQLDIHLTAKNDV